MEKHLTVSLYQTRVINMRFAPCALLIFQFDMVVGMTLQAT